MTVDLYSKHSVHVHKGGNSCTDSKGDQYNIKDSFTFNLQYETFRFDFPNTLICLILFNNNSNSAFDCNIDIILSEFYIEFYKALITKFETCPFRTMPRFDDFLVLDFSNETSVKQLHNLKPLDKSYHFNGGMARTACHY